MLAEHTAPQLRLPPPAQVAVTVPVPLPCFEITKVAFLIANVAFTVVAFVIAVSAQVAPEAVVQPDHDLKSESASAVAVSDSDAPGSTEITQLAIVQFTAPSALVILPLPVRVSVTWIFLSVKVALTLAAALRFDTTHVAPVADEHPVQVAKSESAPGVAVKVTVLP